MGRGRVLQGGAVHSYLVLERDDDGKVGVVEVQPPRGMKRLDRAGQWVALDGSSSGSRDSVPAGAQEAFAAAIAARPPRPASFTLNFVSKSRQLTPDSLARLNEPFTLLRSFPAPEITVVGHTDTVGSHAFNRALGLERARTVSRLIAAAGLSFTALEIDTRGEHEPLVPTPDETPEPANRRVEVSVR